MHHLQQKEEATIEGTEKCETKVMEWINEVEKYYDSGDKSNMKDLWPIRDYVLDNTQTQSKDCLCGWLAAVLIKIESNLHRSKRGLNCGQVHAKGCLRDARGWWQLYTKGRPKIGKSHVLNAGEGRIADVFRVTFEAAMQKEKRKKNKSETGTWRIENKKAEAGTEGATEL